MARLGRHVAARRPPWIGEADPALVRAIEALHAEHEREREERRRELVALIQDDAVGVGSYRTVRPDPRYL